MRQLLRVQSRCRLCCLSCQESAHLTRALRCGLLCLVPVLVCGGENADDRCSGFFGGLFSRDLTRMFQLGSWHLYVASMSAQLSSAYRLPIASPLQTHVVWRSEPEPLRPSGVRPFIESSQTSFTEAGVTEPCQRQLNACKKFTGKFINSEYPTPTPVLVTIAFAGFLRSLGFRRHAFEHESMW